MRAEKTRILIASGAHARWVERAPGASDLVTIGELEAEGIPGFGGPAFVSFESMGGMRHGAGERGDAERRRADFAEQIADALNAQQARGEFERLALVAPARLLREIRERLSSTARSKVKFELAKDLFKKSNHDLRAWLHSPEVA